MSSGWIAVAKARALDDVAPELGLQKRRMSSFSPCPSCGEKDRGSNDRRGPIGVARDKRGWKCQRCQEKGDAVDLVSWVKYGHRSDDLNGAQWTEVRAWFSERGWATATGDRPHVSSSQAMADALISGQGRRRERSELEPEPTGPSTGPFGWREGRAEECADRLWTEDGAVVLKYLLTERKFTEPTIRDWGLGATLIKGEPWLTIPLRDVSERTVNIRFRSLPPADKTYRVCPNRPLPLFGADRLGMDLAGRVVITEGELDVIAMYEYGFTVSVVSGTAGAGAWKGSWLDLLEPYDALVLAYDGDEAGDAGAENFAQKMGKDRCARAVLPHNDAGECLKLGVSRESVDRCLEMAQPMFGVEIRRLHEYQGSIEQLINNPSELVGLPTQSALLNRILGGHRPGVTIISGDTGKGKSTFGHWLLRGQALAGVPVLGTALENRPIAAVQKHLRMEIGGDFLRVDAEQRRDALIRLGDMPLYLLDHYGHISAEQVITTIRYAVRRLGVRQVLIDHLGFLVPPDADDERRSIEAILRALAVTAYTVGVNILLVAHPKGLPPGQARPTMNDLKGASGIKQEASEVIIVETDPPRPNAKPPRPYPASIIHLDKCRSEFGIAGSSATLAFGPLSCTYADLWEETPEGMSGQLVVDPTAYA